VPGTIVSKSHMPRFYAAQTSSGIVRRNRLHLVPRLRDPIQNYTDADVDIDIAFPDQPSSDEPANAEVRSRSPIQTQTGTTLRAPSRYS